MSRAIVILLTIGSIILTISKAQVSYGKRTEYGQINAEYSNDLMENTATLDLDLEFKPQEGPISAINYILGPGDILGINIAGTENMIFSVRVNPTGDVLIPSVGIVKVTGLSLEDAVESIKMFINTNVYPNALVNVTLIGIREFLIQATGAFQKPGFVTVTPLERLSIVVEKAGGLQKYSDENAVTIYRNNGLVETFSLKTMLLEGKLEHNPTLSEGDRIHIPFLKDIQSVRPEITTYNSTAVLVNGFIRKPGAYLYFPGYTVSDYIGLAGGKDENGRPQKVALHRGTEKINPALSDYVKPGDMIYVPSSLGYAIFGEFSLIQFLSASATIIIALDRIYQ